MEIRDWEQKYMEIVKGGVGREYAGPENEAKMIKQCSVLKDDFVKYYFDASHVNQQEYNKRTKS